MPKALTKREKTTLYLTVGIIGFGLLFNFFLGPVFSKNNKLNREISLTRQKLKKYLVLLEQKDAIQNKYSKFFSAAQGISSREQDALISLFAELENLAKGANVKIMDIRPKFGAEGSRKELAVDLRTEGSMEGYLKFIYNLENSLLLLKIKEFQLNSKPNTQVLEGLFSIAQLFAD